MNNIDFSNAPLTDGANVPNTIFMGVTSFDGNGKQITGLKLSEYSGPFFWLTEPSSTLKNLSLMNASYTCNADECSQASVLALADYGTIDNCHVQGSITLNTQTAVFVGGLTDIGGNWGPVEINNSSWDGPITVTINGSPNSNETFVGGLVGLAFPSITITNSRSNANIQILGNLSSSVWLMTGGLVAWVNGWEFWTGDDTAWAVNGPFDPTGNNIEEGTISINAPGSSYPAFVDGAVESQ